MSKIENLETFLNPNSIAIVGVSKNFSSISGKPLNNLINHQFKGNIYPVNPKYDEIGGYECYDRLTDIPGEVDVALIAVSSKRIMQVLDDCEAKGIKHLMMFGSGFAEVGSEGEVLQQQVLERTQAAGMSIIGPNCLGMLNVKEAIPLGFATQFETKGGFHEGNVGFASQSGALGFSLFGLAQEAGVGFSYVMNTGNQMDIHTLDCIEYMIEDHNTDVVAGYLESIPDGEMLIRLAKRAKVLEKPVIILKAGRSEIGSQAAMSHTASLTGSDDTFQAVAKQYGLIIANDVDDMIDLMKVFSRGKVTSGNRVVTLSNSGAAGIVMADYCEMLDLDLVRLNKDTKNQIEAIIPPYGSALNPIDITAQALKEHHIFNETMDVLIKDENVDVIIIHTTFGGELGAQVCENFVKIDQSTEKPIIITVTGTEELTGTGRKILSDANIPVYVTSYRTMVAARKLVDYSQWLQKETDIIPVISEDMKVSTTSPIWTEVEVKDMLSKMDIKVPESRLITVEDDMDKIDREISYPVVCKGISKEVLHKSDAGLVQLNIKNSVELAEACSAIYRAFENHYPDAEVEGILVEKMVEEDNVEMFVGLKDDPEFGTLIVCGLGGIFIEVLEDISIRKVPITIEESYGMIKSLKGYPLLEGIRGTEKRDIQSLAETIVKISDFAVAQDGTVSEMDINPLWVLKEGEGTIALDGVLSWKSSVQIPIT